MLSTLSKYGLLILLAGIAGYYVAQQSYSEDFKKSGAPILTTAGIVHICPQNKIALIERAQAPMGLALFGGHVEKWEAPVQAFARELREELNISAIQNLQLIGVQGARGRDSRQHSVEVTYRCTTTQQPVANSEVKSVKLFTVKELQQQITEAPQSFAFDHARILEEYLQQLQQCNPCEADCRLTLP